MGLFDFFSPKDPLKKKITSIEKEMQEIVQTVYSERVSILTYGAYHLDPKNLVFLIRLKSDIMKFRLQADLMLINKLKALFAKYDYPETARKDIFIIFESQETVDRDFSGEWRYRYT